MSKDRNEGRLRLPLPLGMAALLLGAGCVVNQLQRRRRGERWQTHIRREPVGAALITGASAGIGHAYALRLAALGFDLVLVARRAERLEALAAECRALADVRAEVLVADLSTKEGIGMVEARAAAGDVDFIVHSAGYDVFGDYATSDPARVLGLLNCLQLAAIRLTRRAPRNAGAALRCGRLALIDRCFTPKRKDAVYVAAKAFLNRFTESLALELRDTGVRVQALCSGFVLSEFHDAPDYAQYRIKERIPRWLWMTPEETVDASLRALGEGRIVVVPGLKNQAIVAATRTGLSPYLMRALASFFPGTRPAYALPAAALDDLACPHCKGALTLEGTRQEGVLACAACAKTYPIVEGIPRFAPYGNLGGLNRRFAGLYDWFSLVYGLFSRIAFAFIGTTEGAARTEILDRLDAHGKVLEVSVGPGVNLPYLRNYPAVREIHGLDLSNGQLARYRSFAQRRAWSVALSQGDAEALPYRDNTFDAVVHVGGINFFNDKRQAIAEMVRVAKPGARIVICDEGERAARGYEVTLPGFRRSFWGGREAVRPPSTLCRRGWRMCGWTSPSGRAGSIAWSSAKDKR